MSAVVLLGLRVLGAIALYAFLAWALLLLWRSLQQEALLIASRKVAPLGLRIESPDNEMIIRQFTEGDISIGRDPDCECPLEDGTISGRHARLDYHHNQWWLEDLESTNGTKLNDNTVQTPTVVLDGDTIRCGQTTLTILLG